MKKIIIIILCFCATSIGFAQDEVKEKPVDKPVRSPWESSYLMDNQTTLVPYKNTMESVIQHRFGGMGNGYKDVWGLYAPGANIRLGINYTVLDDVMIGAGLTKKNMYSDFHIKWNILKQTRKNTVPVSVAVYGNMAIDGSNEKKFGENYSFTNRFAYFSQILIGRKFTDWLSIQVSTSFTHFNSVEADADHDKVGVGLIGRIKFSDQSSLQFQYDMPLHISGISEQLEFKNPSKPNFGIGYEVSTSTHAFQIYVSSSDAILPQDTYMFNQKDWTDGGLVFGFTITRLWGF